MQLKLHYNAPVTLTFALASIGIFILNSIFGGLLDPLTQLHGFSFNSITDYISLIGYTMGHSSTEHIMGNLLLILLVGPILEERYGGKSLVVMMLTTAILTAILQLIIFPRFGLMGASGLAFMFIILASFVNLKRGKIPLTFVLVVLFYLGKEIYTAVAVEDNVSQFAHIAGGILGSVFGFVANRHKPIA